MKARYIQFGHQQNIEDLRMYYHPDACVVYNPKRDGSNMAMIEESISEAKTKNFTS